jgi:predicted secreted protein
MTITAAIVVFAVLWFLVFFVVLQLTVKTQGESGHVEPGTPASAPAEETIRRHAITTTWIAVALWVVIAGVIWSGAITVRDLDFFGRMGPKPVESTN